MTQVRPNLHPLHQTTSEDKQLADRNLKRRTQQLPQNTKTRREEKTSTQKPKPIIQRRPGRQQLNTTPCPTTTTVTPATSHSTYPDSGLGATQSPHHHHGNSPHQRRKYNPTYHLLSKPTSHPNQPNNHHISTPNQHLTIPNHQLATINRSQLAHTLHPTGGHHNNPTGGHHNTPTGGHHNNPTGGHHNNTGGHHYNPTGGHNYNPTGGHNTYQPGGHPQPTGAQATPIQPTSTTTGPSAPSPAHTYGTGTTPTPTPTPNTTTQPNSYHSQPQGPETRPHKQPLTDSRDSRPNPNSQTPTHGSLGSTPQRYNTTPDQPQDQLKLSRMEQEVAKELDNLFPSLLTTHNTASWPTTPPTTTQPTNQPLPTLELIPLPPPNYPRGAGNDTTQHYPQPPNPHHTLPRQPTTQQRPLYITLQEKLTYSRPQTNTLTTTQTQLRPSPLPSATTTETTEANPTNHTSPRTANKTTKTPRKERTYSKRKAPPTVRYTGTKRRNTTYDEDTRRFPRHHRRPPTQSEHQATSTNHRRPQPTP